MNILPVLFDHSSRGILTFWDDKDITESGAQSIIKMAKSAGLKKLFFVSNTVHTFVEAMKATEKAGIQMVFGLEILMTTDCADVTDISVRNHHKVIVVAKNSAAYEDLIKMFSAWQTRTTNYLKVRQEEYRRFDYAQLKEFWTPNLKLVLPFFDNPISVNALKYTSGIIPSFPTDDITILREVDTGHPHEVLINYYLDQFNVEKKYKEVPSKMIYYEKRADMKAWITYRTIRNKTSFDSPELPYCASDQFSWEDYQRLEAVV